MSIQELLDIHWPEVDASVVVLEKLDFDASCFIKRIFDGRECTNPATWYMICLGCNNCDYVCDVHKEQWILMYEQGGTVGCKFCLTSIRIPEPIPLRFEPIRQGRPRS